MSQALTSLGPSFPLSMVTLLDPVRKQLLPVDSERVMKLAERLTGLHDYGDSDSGFRQRLDETIETVLRTDWNTLGRFGVREQRAATRWLLKCPWHLWNLKALLTVYPDAQVIQTHRGLVDTIGSQCSLTARIAAKFQGTLDLHDVGRFWLDYSRTGLERGLQAKSALPKSRVHDVRRKSTLTPSTSLRAEGLTGVTGPHLRLAPSAREPESH